MNVMLTYSRDYLSWHYRYGVLRFFIVVKEIVRFIFNLLSIRLFLRTLFAPMFNVRADIYATKELSDMVAMTVSNLMLRVVGFILRLAFILIGFMGAVCVLFIGLILLICWIFLPILLLANISALVMLISQYI